MTLKELVEKINEDMRQARMSCADVQNKNQNLLIEVLRDLIKEDPKAKRDQREAELAASALAVKEEAAYHLAKFADQVAKRQQADMTSATAIAAGVIKMVKEALVVSLTEGTSGDPFEFARKGLAQAYFEMGNLRPWWREALLSVLKRTEEESVPALEKRLARKIAKEADRRLRGEGGADTPDFMSDYLRYKGGKFVVAYHW